MATTSYTVSGILYKKSPIEVKSEKFSVQNIIVKTVEEYPQYLQIQASNQRIEQLATVNEGDSIKADVNVQGRLWTGSDGVEKCFNTLSLWKCEVVAVGQVAQPQATNGGVQDDQSLPF